MSAMKDHTVVRRARVTGIDLIAFPNQIPRKVYTAIIL